MKKLELQNFGVQELDAREMREVDGGQIPKIIKGGIWGYLAHEIITNWKDIKKGIKDGFNAQL